MAERAIALAAIGPQPGPQTMFARTSAEVAFFGGSPGGGKSVSLLYDGAKLTALPHVRSMRALYLRRRELDLLKGGGLWDKSEWIFPQFGGRAVRSEREWIFEATTGAIEHRHRITLGHMHREADRFTYDGTEYDLIAFDELQQFTPVQFWYMLSRLRSVSGLRPRMRASLNPLPYSWLGQVLGWWIGRDGYVIPDRSGAIRWFIRDEEHDALRWYDSREEALQDDPDGDPMSFTFILATLGDNRALDEADPTYRRRLRQMMRTDRMRLIGERDKDGRDRGGNWLVREGAGQFFRGDDFKIVDEAPSRVLRTVRFWDKASSEPTPKHPNPDWTRGVRVSLCEGGLLWIDDVVSLQGRPVDVMNLMRTTAEDDSILVEVGLWKDTGQAGVVDVDVTADALAGFVVEVIDSHSADTTDVSEGNHKSSRAKRAFAKAWAPHVEKGRVYVKRAEWTDELVGECHAFPDGAFDDHVDAISGAAQMLIGQGLGFWNALRDLKGKVE
jgi:phage terminase large subunit-like protein